MKGFIRLTPRRGYTRILVNPEHIVSIEDMRTCTDIRAECDEYTNIETTSIRIEVKETEQEIINLIKEVIK